MAEEEKKKVKAVKPKKTPGTTSVSILREVAGTVHKSRKEVVSEAYKLAQKRGVVKNARGHTITEANLSSLLSAMCRDITNEKGKSKIPGGKNGWWADHKVVESKEEGKEAFSIVSKA